MYYMQAMQTLVGGDHAVLQINDKKLVAPLRIRLSLTDTSSDMI